MGATVAASNWRMVTVAFGREIESSGCAYRFFAILGLGGLNYRVEFFVNMGDDVLEDAVG